MSAILTLVLHRTGDMIVLVEHGWYLAAQISGATSVELPDGEQPASGNPLPPGAQLRSVNRSRFSERRGTRAVPKTT